MDLANTPLFSAITRKMNWLTQRQQVLARNVANVDTPGFAGSDLKPLDFRGELNAAAHLAGSSSFAIATGTLQPVATNPAHIGAATASGSLKASVDRDSIEREPNGNTVSLEDEMMKVSETANEYQLMTNLYKKQVGMITMAIGRGN